MNLKASGDRRFRNAVALLGLAGLLAAPGTTVAAGAEGRSPGPSVHGASLQGVWGVTVTLHLCDDPSVTLGPPFNSIVTFAEGGTIVESSASLAFAPGQRTGAQGTWSRLGRSTYRQRMLALILFDTPANPPFSPGFFQGSQTVTHTLSLQDRDNFTSTGSNSFFRADGTEYRSGCSSAVGRRFR